MLQFTDLKDEQQDPRPRAGVLLRQDEKWFAVKAGQVREGMGPIDSLAEGLWFTNMGFDDTKALSGETRHVLLRFDGWARIRMDQVRSAWGLDQDNNLTTARRLSEISDRLWHLVWDLAVREAARGKSELRVIMANIARGASLATGLTHIHQSRLSRTKTPDKRMQDHINQTLMIGIYMPKGAALTEGSIELPFSFGRFSHAMRVCSGKIPQASSWRFAPRPDGMSAERFMEEVRKTGAPAILRAMPTRLPGVTGDHLNAFINGPRGVSVYRSRFLAEEIIIAGDAMKMDIEGAYVSSGGWVEGSTWQILQDLEEAAGGPDAAAASWTANILAENLLNSGWRMPKGSDDGVPAESAWIAARDRVAMMPAISAMTDSGATLLKAQAGNVTMTAPSDPEVLTMVLQAAWEHGLSLPVEVAVQLDGMGVAIPSDEESYGGNAADYLVASLSHTGKRRALWALDAIQDAPAAERNAKFRELVTGR